MEHDQVSECSSDTPACISASVEVSGGLGSEREGGLTNELSQSEQDKANALGFTKQKWLAACHTGRVYDVAIKMTAWGDKDRADLLRRECHDSMAYIFGLRGAP